MKLLFLLFLALFCCFTLTNVTADTDDPLADLEDPLDEEEEFILAKQEVLGIYRVVQDSKIFERTP